MVNVRRIAFLGLALLLSAGTVVVAQQWMHGEVKRASAARASGAASAAPPVQVLVARTALPAGTILKPEQLRWQAWPDDGVAGGYLTAAAASPERLAGSVIRTAVAQGEPLTPGMVVAPGDRSFMAAVLKPGMRAVTINVSASTGVGGFVFPGDHVDLILSRLVEAGGSKRFVSETVLRDVRVVGVDQRASNDKKDVAVPQTATLEVSPKQAEVVTVVSELGKLSLSLRSLAAGEASAELAPVSRTWDREAVQAGDPPPSRSGAPAPPRPRPPAPAAVQVVRGSQISSIGVQP